MAIAAGAGRGVPAAAVYELHPSTMLLVFDRQSDVSQLVSTLDRYQDVWVVFSHEPPTAALEKQLVERLEQLGRKPDRSGEEGEEIDWALFQRPPT